MGMSEYLLTIVVNNYTRDSRFRAEHGFAVHIEQRSTGQRLLFDTGNTPDILLGNAEAMGIDLRRVGTVILSHGHYDHTGGLAALLELTGPVPVVAHPDAFAPKFSASRKFHAIGPPLRREDYEARGARLLLAQNEVALTDSLTVMGEIPRKHAFEEEAVKGFFTVRDGRYLPDTLPDDRSLVIRRPGEGIHLICGCCHSGLVNTLDRALAQSGEKRVLGIVGGLHTVGASPDRLEKTIEALRERDPGFLAPLHCAGMRETAELARAFGEKVKFLSAGDTLEL